MGFRLTSAAFIVVFAAYLFLGGFGVTDHGRPRHAPYNLLARGMLSGHLYVDRPAPPILAQLRDPYDPEANRDARDARDGLNDFSYFHGRLYLYFGVAPALFIFIPWHLLTGGWLPHWVAVVFLCSAGLAVNLSLVHAVRLRVFPRAGPWALAACVPLLGLASGAPLLVARAELWEVPIAFSYLLVAVALRCLWEADSAAGGEVKWIALASLAAGAAFAARPTMLPNAAILLIPFLSRATRRDPRAWAAAAVPFAFCGAGVALYNFGRFGSPFEFGLRLTLERYYNGPSLSFVPTNLGLYLLQPVRWSGLFPFVHAPAIGLQSHLPPNHAGAEQIMGALLNVPVLWAALAVPAWMMGGHRDRGLLPLALAAAWVALSSLALFSTFFFACSRYQFEFVPALALLAALGVLALEAGWGGRVRRLARGAWIPALLFSSAFTVLYGIDRSVTDHNTYGLTCLAYRDFSGAEHEFDVARLLSPRNPGSRAGEGALLFFQGRRREAQVALEAVTRDFPDHALGHYFLGVVLSSEGRRPEALAEFQAAHRLDPGNPGINKGLASALAPGR